MNSEKKREKPLPDPVLRTVGFVVIIIGWMVTLSYLISFKFYKSVFGNYDIAGVMVCVKALLGLFIISGGSYIKKGVGWSRWMVIGICLLLGSFSIYAHIKVSGEPLWPAVVLYLIPIILLLIPQVSRRFKGKT